jgi:Ca2+-binding EF-hand superfamily protein
VLLSRALESLKLYIDEVDVHKLFKALSRPLDSGASHVDVVEIKKLSHAILSLKTKSNERLDLEYVKVYDVIIVYPYQLEEVMVYYL